MCDFEAGFCDWTQDINDQFDWTRKRNGTLSKGTGPPYDHTTESQYGMSLILILIWHNYVTAVNSFANRLIKDTKYPLTKLLYFLELEFHILLVFP